MNGVATLKNFTPVSDDICRKHGLNFAAVIGRMWRYAQGEHGVCDASQQTIADELKISHVTVRSVQQLAVTLGYLEDMTPGLVNRPHIYRVKNLMMIAELSMVDETGSTETASGSTNLSAGSTNLSTEVDYSFEEEREREETKKESARDKALKRQASRKKPAKLGDLVDAGLHYGVPAMQRAHKEEDLLCLLEKELAIGLGRGRRVAELGEWLRVKEEQGEPLTKFIEYLKADEFRLGTTSWWNGDNVSNKLKGMWPQAFKDEDQSLGFVGRIA